MKISDKFQTVAKVTVWGGIAIRFDSPESFWTKLAEEQEFFNDLVNRSSKLPYNDYAMNTAVGQVQNQINQAISNFQQIAPADASEDRFKALIASYGNRKLLVPGSAPAHYVARVMEQEPDQALRVAICFYDVQVPLERTVWGSKWGRAAALAEMLRLGWTKNIDGLDAALGEFSNNWDARFLALDTRLNSELDKASDVSNQFADLLRTETERVAGLTMQHDSEVSAAIASGQAQIEAIKETYKAELTLQAPTTYWREKQVAHRWVSSGWALAFVFASFLAVLFVWHVWSITAASHLDGKVPASYGYFIPSAGATFLAIWVLRILSRQLMANLAFVSDAGERVAMVKTFLALMQKPEHVMETDRILILSALFRPTVPNGDDAAPPNWFDLIMQRLK